ncbi:hypothetical protein IWW38_005920, partial [Coemansia aciculifera]
MAQFLAQQEQQEQRQQQQNYQRYQQRQQQQFRGQAVEYVPDDVSDGVSFDLRPSQQASQQNHMNGYHQVHRNASASQATQRHTPMQGSDMTMGSLAGRQHQLERRSHSGQALTHIHQPTYHSRYAPAHRPVPVQSYLRQPVHRIPTEQLQPVVLQHGSMPGAHQQRMCMLGQLRAVVTVSPGSEHFHRGLASHLPAKLKKRPGLAQEVEVFDNRDMLIGTLEQSVTQTIHALLSDGAIQVLGLMTEPLRGKFIAPILLSFYAGMALARDVVRLFERSGIYLDQSSAETQTMLRELEMDSNRLTQGMAYVSRHPTRDQSGLVNVTTNSDSHVPSVFTEMGLHASRDGGGGV